MTTSSKLTHSWLLCRFLLIKYSVRTGIALPANFEKIPLAKAQKDKLRAVGMLDGSDEEEEE